MNIQIVNQEIHVKEFDGQRVITLKDIDRVHERPEGTARRNFNKNRKHFIEGEDYFVRNSSEAKTELGITAPSGLILITESGYLMIVKSLTDDLSWHVQRQLVNYYFRVKSEQTLTKEEWMKLIDCISRTSKEAIPLLKIALNEIASGKFDCLATINLKPTHEFGAKLVKWKEAQGITQSELGKVLGLPKSTVSTYCNGKARPELGRLKQIAERMNVSMDYFFE